jgi:hypothetical protein
VTGDTSPGLRAPATVATEIATAIDDQEARRRDRALALAAQLEAEAEALGDGMLRHAAAIIRGQRSTGGRKRRDLAAPLDAIRRLVDEGHPERSVVGIVALQFTRGTAENPESLARLLRMRRAEEKNGKNGSIPSQAAPTSGA